MASVRQRIGRLLGGGEGVQAALDEHAQAIRELQRQVAELREVVARIDAGTADAEGWATVGDGLRSAVDDIGSRLAALAERVDRLEA